MQEPLIELLFATFGCLTLFWSFLLCGSSFFCSALFGSGFFGRFFLFRRGLFFSLSSFCLSLFAFFRVARLFHISSLWAACILVDDAFNVVTNYIASRVFAAGVEKLTKARAAAYKLACAALCWAWCCFFYLFTFFRDVYDPFTFWVVCAA